MLVDNQITQSLSCVISAVKKEASELFKSSMFTHPIFTSFLPSVNAESALNFMCMLRKKKKKNSLATLTDSPEASAFHLTIFYQSLNALKRENRENHEFRLTTSEGRCISYTATSK